MVLMSFSSVSDSSQCLVARIELKKVNMGVFDAMEWLGDRYEGVYFVQLNHNQILDHLSFFAWQLPCGSLYL